LSGELEKAIKEYKEIIKKYPNSQASTYAEKQIARLEKRRNIQQNIKW
jgi:outer membrane protein assembly factor BamD (BamD/ComL family)